MPPKKPSSKKGPSEAQLRAIQNMTEKSRAARSAMEDEEDEREAQEAPSPRRTRSQAHQTPLPKQPGGRRKSVAATRRGELDWKHSPSPRAQSASPPPTALERTQVEIDEREANRRKMNELTDSTEKLARATRELRQKKEEKDGSKGSGAPEVDSNLGTGNPLGDPTDGGFWENWGEATPIQGDTFQSSSSSSSSSSSLSSPSPSSSHFPSLDSSPPVGPNMTQYSTSDTGAHDGMWGAGGEGVTGNDEALEHAHPQEAKMFKKMEDVIALGTARALAGVPQPPAPQRTEEPAQGYLGGRNVENEDIKNSAATGTARGPEQHPGVPGGKPDPLTRGGDAITEAKATRNTTTDTLRPTFGIAPPNGVIPTKGQQVQSDLLFSEFSVVAPGNGLGVTNKMFLMEEYRDKNFVYREPLAEPRKYDGPAMTVEPIPLQWQNQITRTDRHALAAKDIAAQASGVLLERRAGDGSLNVLGDDYGMYQRVSDKGLKRPTQTPLEPQIRLPKSWERVKALPGAQWSKKQFRRLFDSQRYPERFDSNVAMEGGPIMKKASALAVYPFPITST